MQIKNFPGTSIPFNATLSENSFLVISSLCAATGGITLSQLTEMTGLEGTTIQNWVKRGWVSKTIGKKYPHLLSNNLEGVKAGWENLIDKTFECDENVRNLLL